MPIVTGRDGQSNEIQRQITPPCGLGDPNNCDWYMFSSRHPAVVQFCFGNVSTRGLRRGTTVSQAFALGTPAYTSDWAILMQRSGRNDGSNRDTATLEN